VLIIFPALQQVQVPDPAMPVLSSACHECGAPVWLAAEAIVPMAGRLIQGGVCLVRCVPCTRLRQLLGLGLRP
jgi:hypothetical protein